jgi:PAS domain S-box-containing protein
MPKEKLAMRSPSSWQATAATLAQVIEHLVMREVIAQKRGPEERAYHGMRLENMHDAALGTDDRFVLTEWNRGAEEMFGWTADEALGQVVSDLVPPGYSREQLDQDLRELTETGRWRGERTWQAKDGSLILAEGLTVALRGSQGDTRGYLCITRDMRERTRAETQARERIGTVVESSTDGFYAMDLDWRLTYINGHAVQDASRLARTKFSRGDLLGRTLWEIRPGLVGSTMEERFRSAVRDQASVMFEYAYPGNGSSFDVHAYPRADGLSV